MTLDRGAGEDGAVGALDRLVLDRPEETRRELLDLVPRLAAVRRAAGEAGPVRGFGAGLVEKEERLAAAEEEHRIPARKARLIRRYLRLRPHLAVEPGQPDFHVLGALRLAAEPRGQEPARFDFDEGGSMTRGKRSFFKNKHR